MPQMWLPSPTRPVTFVQSGTLQTDFPFTGRIPQTGTEVPHIGTEVPHTGTEVPQMDKVKKILVCTPGDLPNCWRVCHDEPNALFLILQELMSPQSGSPGRCREGKKKVSSGKESLGSC